MKENRKEGETGGWLKQRLTVVRKRKRARHGFKCEVVASKQNAFIAASDAIGQSLGFGLALSSIAAIREILGTGGLFGIPVLPEVWPDWVIMVLPPGAFLTFGLLLGTVNWYTARKSANNQA